MTQATGITQQPARRQDKLRFSSPHGVLYAIPISVAFWLAILVAVGVIR